MLVVHVLLGFFGLFCHASPLHNATTRQHEKRVTGVTDPKSPKGVFAHFMVGNVPNWSQNDWAAEISYAQNAHIDAFALNMANAENGGADMTQVGNAFAAAQGTGFSLFFSFDYAGNGPWDAGVVTNLINQYSGNSAYFKYNGAPFVSTFEGPANAGDWAGIKQNTGCFFMPDWSSLGAKDALQQAGGVADGLFSWAAWPWGDQPMDTYVDASYLQFLGGKPFMMAVSPWFYTNLPGYTKNWLWKGDSLWHDRWEQVMMLQPDFVEIISWNDYGESHYIGPLHPEQYSLFDSNHGKAPFNYADGISHDGWRALLPFYIDTYKNGIASFSNEILTAWYRINPARACSSGDTSGNTASQLQLEFDPTDIMDDSIFFSVLLAEDPGPPSVTIGGNSVPATWLNIPYGNIGVYHGSAPFQGNTGSVDISINGINLNGPDITTSCTNGLVNFNPWAGYSIGAGVSATPTLSLSEMTCVSGTAPGNFQGLCEFSCQYGYCPVGACQCLALGSAPTPTGTGGPGYPISGEGSSYSGLCSYDCNYGYCPDTACGPEQVPLTEPTVSPFLPITCTGGQNRDDHPDYADLCGYGCQYGFCPEKICQCTSFGNLNLPPPITHSSPRWMELWSTDSGLCNFACTRGHCPSDVCKGGQDRPYENAISYQHTICNQQSQYPTLADIFDHAGDIPDPCKNTYIIKALSDNITNTINAYNDLLAHGYDADFDAFVTPLPLEIGAILMDTWADMDQFNFVWHQQDNNGNYADDAGGHPSPYENNEDYSDPNAFPVGGDPNTWIDMQRKDPQGYLDYLGNKGVGSNFVVFTDNQVDYCTRDADDQQVTPCPVTVRETPQYPNDYSPPNPKNAISTLLGNITTLGDGLNRAYYDVLLDFYLGDTSELIDTSSYMVGLFVASFQSMQVVDAIGHKTREENRKDLIINIISAIFLIIPIGGELLEGLDDIYQLGKLIKTVTEAADTGSDAANFGLAAYTAAADHDPTSLVFSVFDIFLKGFGSTLITEKAQGDFESTFSYWRNTNEITQKIAELAKSTSPDELAKSNPALGTFVRAVRGVEQFCSINK